MKQSMNFEHIQTKWPQLHQLAAFANHAFGYLSKIFICPAFLSSNKYHNIKSTDLTNINPLINAIQLRVIAGQNKLIERCSDH